MYDSDAIKNDEIIKLINNGLIELRNSINNKEIPENENLKKSSQLKSSTLIKNKEVNDTKYKLRNKCFKDYQ